jgi:hypothetical protein
MAGRLGGRQPSPEQTNWATHDAVVTRDDVGPAVRLAWIYLWRLNSFQCGPMCRPVHGDEIAKFYNKRELRKSGRDYLEGLRKSKLADVENGAVTYLVEPDEADKMRHLELLRRSGQAELAFLNDPEEVNLAEEREEEPVTMQLASLPDPLPAEYRRTHRSAPEEPSGNSVTELPPATNADFSPETLPEKPPENSPARTYNPSKKDSKSPITHNPSKERWESNKTKGNGENSGGFSGETSSSPSRTAGPVRISSMESQLARVLDPARIEQQHEQRVAETTQFILSEVGDRDFHPDAARRIAEACEEKLLLKRDVKCLARWVKKKRNSHELEGPPGAVFVGKAKKKFALHRVPWINEK